jgi:L-rhamnose-H+ transport protein
MTQQFAIGLGLVLAAGFLQGSFMLPMTLTRRWQWEHGWAMFSLLGMLLFNGVLAACTVPHLLSAYRATPASDLYVLAMFGALWGAGAILFGLGMARLGMAVGYPIIMGLILSLGAIVPLLLQSPAELASRAGLLLLAGMAVTIGGVILCSQAAAAKDAQPADKGDKAVGSGLGAGLVIAVLAGVFSCFPNVGMNHAESLKAAAVGLGASPDMAGNAAWALLFIAGFVLNFCYCLGLMVRRGNLGALANDFGRNLGWIALMAAMWIGSFYLYGMGAARMGAWGGIVGWPLFISLAILVGNLWGLWRGEWRNANPSARARLNFGLAVLLLAVAVFGAASALKAPDQPSSEKASAIGFRCAVDLP